LLISICSSQELHKENSFVVRELRNNNVVQSIRKE
jgi:hypothetical protein